MGSAKATDFHVVRIDEDSLPTLCLAKIGQSDRFCVDTTCLIQSHKRCSVKFVPLLDHFYMPAGNLSASTDTYIPIEAVPSKYRDIFHRGFMPCRKWLHLFVDAMHDVSFEEFEDMPQEEFDEKMDEEEELGYQHNRGEGEDSGGGDDEVLPVVKFAASLDGVGQDMDLGGIGTSYEGAVEMLRNATVLSIGEQDIAI